MATDRSRGTRRRFLSASGVLFGLALAGCTRDDTASGGAESSHDDGGHDDGSHDDDTHDVEEDAHSHDHESAHELGHPKAHVRVEMVSEDGHHFRPHVVHVQRGGTVEWVRESSAHDTRAYHPESHGDQQRIPDDTEPWASELLSEEGDTFEHTFESEGVYDYLCRPHEEMGMIGSVLVGWPDPDTQPGLEPPSEGFSEVVSDALDRYNEQVWDALHDHDDDH